MKNPREQMQTNRSHTEDSNELLGFRFKDFYVVFYETQVVAQEVFDKNKIIFKTKPAFGVNSDLELIGINIEFELVYPSSNGKRLIASFKTRTEFETKGLKIKKNANNTEVAVLFTDIQAMCNLAVSTSRGALSVVSDGKYLLPIINVKGSLFNNEENSDRGYLWIGAMPFSIPSSTDS